jgi:hypothetical protein
LQQIHQKDINIAIYNREIEFLSQEISLLLDKEIEIRVRGTIESILSSIEKELSNLNKRKEWRRKGLLFFVKAQRR